MLYLFQHFTIDLLLMSSLYSSSQSIWSGGDIIEWKASSTIFDKFLRLAVIAITEVLMTKWKKSITNNNVMTTGRGTWLNCEASSISSGCHACLKVSGEPSCETSNILSPLATESAESRAWWYVSNSPRVGTNKSMMAKILLMHSCYFHVSV